MAQRKNTSLVISKAKPHTVKKFELIEKYVDEWARKILGFGKSNGLLFIDCMSNSGVYTDIDSNTVYGTPIRVAERLNEIVQNYPGKKAVIFFNDIDETKTAELRRQIDSRDLKNIDITISNAHLNVISSGHLLLSS